MGFISAKNVIEKQVRKIISNKIAEIFTRKPELFSRTTEKELLQKLEHKVLEMQVKHKLYKGQTTKVVNDKGATYHEISEDAKVLVLYVSNLILLSKKNDSLKTIDFYGKYFYDRDLTEANLRKLKGLALIRRRKDDQYENAVRALREFSKANIIFSQLRNKQG